MGRDAYATALYVVSSDIEKVGGKGAYVGMDREGPEGKQYVLVQSHDVSVDFTNGKLMLGYKGGQAFKVTLASNTGRCSGIPAHGVKAVTSGDYFWMQVMGHANNIISSGVTNGTWVYSLGSGVASSATVYNTLTLTAGAGSEATTLINTGVLGWAIGDEVSSKCVVYVMPGFQWTGTSVGLSLVAGDGE